MPITADHIRTTVTAYLDQHPQDRDALADVLELLEAGADITCRKEFRGHVTAGAILVDDDGDALFIHHVALGKWLTPGGPRRTRRRQPRRHCPARPGGGDRDQPRGHHAGR